MLEQRLEQVRVAEELWPRECGDGQRKKGWWLVKGRFGGRAAMPTFGRYRVFPDATAS